MRLSASDLELLTKNEVAAMLRVSLKTINQWVYKEMIPNIKVNGVVRFDRRKIEEWCRQSTRADNG